MSTLTQSKHKSKKQSRRKLSKEEKFQRQWDKVQRLQKKNEKLKDDVAELATQVANAVESEEKAFTTALYEQSLRLIKFVPKKTLPQYLREELVFWIEGNIEDIHHNPFSLHLDMHSIHETFVDALDEHFAIEKEKLKKKYGDLDVDEEPLPQGESESEDDTGEFTEDMFEELFAEFAGEDEDLAEDDEDFDDFYNDFHEEEYNHEEQLRQESRALDALLKSSSINKLFRRVARAIHPDLAENEAERKEKHDIMTRLTTARDNKDIITILAMYTEYVGEPPTDLFSKDLDKMTLLLEFQEKQLEQQKQDIINENPHQAAIYHAFSSSSKAQLNKKIRTHKQMLARRLDAQKSLTLQLTSLAKLKPLLRERMDARRAEFLEGLMDMHEFEEYFD